MNLKLCCTASFATKDVLNMLFFNSIPLAEFTINLLALKLITYSVKSDILCNLIIYQLPAESLSDPSKGSPPYVSLKTRVVVEGTRIT